MSKKLLIYFLGLTMVSFAAMKTASASIIGSPHDFSGQAWSGGQVCVVCHTPHNANNTLVPLWNHTLTSATFTPYSSASLKASVGQPNPPSKACLSCHDGTVAIDSFGGSIGTHFVSGGDLLGTDLSNDHPISFTYDTTLATADGGLYNPATKTVTALGGKFIKDSMLIGGKLECGSCHDVHRDKGDSSSTTSLLLVNNTNSALCLTCHNK